MFQSKFMRMLHLNTSKKVDDRDKVEGSSFTLGSFFLCCCKDDGHGSMFYSAFSEGAKIATFFLFSSSCFFCVYFSYLLSNVS